MLWLSTLKLRLVQHGSLLLAVLLFASQLHLCEPTYILPTGQRCAACPTIAKSKLAATSSDVTFQGDCRDCCKLTTCEHNVKTTPVVLASSHVVHAILPDQPDFEIHFFVIVYPIAAPRIEGIPPTGPPSPDNSRAPPSSAFA